MMCLSVYSAAILQYTYRMVKEFGIALIAVHLQTKTSKEEIR